MGKRSNFDRVERDFYPTPHAAVVPLLGHIDDVTGFYEPCVGDYDLVYHLQDFGIVCYGASDISQGRDALNLTEEDVGCCSHIITNPPWDRKILHPMIDHFRALRPTWLLFDADWMHTKQSSEYMNYCRKVVSVGRVKWIPDSKMTGKDNCAWYLFDKDECETVFMGR